MKFNYCKDFPEKSGFFPEYCFQFTLTEDEVLKVKHRYAITPDWMMRVFESSSGDSQFQMPAALRIIEKATNCDEVDLGINYKEKYDELVKLLKPHQIDDEMSPSTTLKMILRYSRINEKV